MDPVSTTSAAVDALASAAEWVRQFDGARAQGPTAGGGDVNAWLLKFLEARVAHVAQASGRYAKLVETVRKSRTTAPARQDPPPPTPQPIPDRDEDRSNARRAPAAASPSSNANASPSPMYRALEMAVSAGAIPNPLSIALLLVADGRVSPARRAQAALRAAFEMGKFEDQAFAATPYLAQLRAMENEHAGSLGRVRDAGARLNSLLAEVYKHPANAARELRKLALECRNSTHLAHEIARTPELAGELKGGLLKRAERARAVATVPKLAAAIEERGRHRERLSRDEAGLRDIRQRPAVVPGLGDALRAHAVLEAVRAAMQLAEPVSSASLLHASHEAALAMTDAELAEATDLSPAFRTHLEDQAGRLSAIRALQDNRDPTRAVDHFEAAAQAMAANVNAHERLTREGSMLPAKQAYTWAEKAQAEMAWAAKTILSDFNQHTEAAHRQVLPHVVAFQRDMEAATGHDRDMEPATEMGGM